MVFSWLVTGRHLCLCYRAAVVRGGELKCQAETGELWNSIGPLAPPKAAGLRSCCPGRAGLVQAGLRSGQGHPSALTFGGGNG